MGLAALLAACRAEGIATVEIDPGEKIIKIFDPGFRPIPGHPWTWPFVNLFVYRTTPLTGAVPGVWDGSPPVSPEMHAGCSRRSRPAAAPAGGRYSRSALSGLAPRRTPVIVESPAGNENRVAAIPPYPHRCAMTQDCPRLALSRQLCHIRKFRQRRAQSSRPSARPRPSGCNVIWNETPRSCKSRLPATSTCRSAWP